MRRITTLSISIAFVILAACGSDSDDAANKNTPPATPPILIGGNDDGGLIGDLDKCATDKKKAERVPVDMVIGLDTSFSMDFDQKWTNVRAALKQFVSNPAYAELGIGLQFFPIVKQCNVGEYQKL